MECSKVSHIPPKNTMACHYNSPRPGTNYDLVIFFFGSFFSELGTEPRALRFLGKRSTTELNPQPLTWLFLYCFVNSMTKETYRRKTLYEAYSLRG